MKARPSSDRSSQRARRPKVSKSYPALVEKILLQPWFLPQRVAFSIHAMVPVDFYKKMRYVFEDYGCLICETESNYHSNGMCQNCNARTRQKILLSLRRRGRQGGQPRLDLELFRQQKIAKKLLSRFVGVGQTAPRKPHHGVKQNNPVYEALAYRVDMSRRAGWGTPSILGPGA
jgi:hypothetical protein